jgi:hypothetical protein
MDIKKHAELTDFNFSTITVMVTIKWSKCWSQRINGIRELPFIHGLVFTVPYRTFLKRFFLPTLSMRVIKNVTFAHILQKNQFFALIFIPRLNPAKLE